jgi:hypothetical protein
LEAAYLAILFESVSIFVSQTLFCTRQRVLARDGIISIDSTAIKNAVTIGTTIPVMAIPVPLSCPWLLEIITREIIPNIIASGAVRKNVQKLRNPKTSDAIASALVRPDGVTAGPTLIST